MQKLVVITFFMISFAITAQVIPTKSSTTPLTEYNLDLKNVNGSPFEVDKFQVGDVIDITTKVTRKYYLRYNVFNDEIQIKDGEDATEINALTKTKSVYAVINNKEYRYIKALTNKGLGVSGYFIKLHEDESVSLFKTLSKNFFPPKPAKTTLEKDVKAKFTNVEKYFIFKDKVLTEVFLNKKKTIKALDNSSEIQAFIKKNKLKLKNEDELIELVTYYNTL